MDIDFAQGRAWLETATDSGEEPEVKAWVDSLLDGTVFEVDGKRFVEWQSSGQVQWSHSLQKTSSPRTLAVQHDSGEVAVCIHRFAAPRSGAFIFWTVRDLQPAMKLQLTAAYSTAWINHQWQAWLDFVEQHKLPADQMVRSTESLRRQKAKYQQQDFKEHSMQEYTCSTCCILALLCRWSLTLHGSGRQGAAGVLASLIENYLPRDGLFCYLGKLTEEPAGLQHTWPASVQASTYRLEVVNRMVYIEPIIEAVPELKAALKRLMP
eukprot:11199476-Lingulodinium_polyedra.AAC.1